MHNLKISVL